MAGFFCFSDDQWSRIEPLLPVNAKGARRVDDRRVLSGIVHALQCGGRWGD
jgi:transposase